MILEYISSDKYFNKKNIIRNEEFRGKSIVYNIYTYKS